MTLLIPKENKKTFEKLFKFLDKNECEVGLFADGLKYRNSEIEGIVYKKAFIEYPDVKHIKINNLKPTIKEVKGAENMWLEIGF